MNEVLSQSEIDNLLSAISTGDLDSEAGEIEGGEIAPPVETFDKTLTNSSVKMYDFKISPALLFS